MSDGISWSITKGRALGLKTDCCHLNLLTWQHLLLWKLQRKGAGEDRREGDNLNHGKTICLNCPQGASPVNILYEGLKGKISGSVWREDIWFLKNVQILMLFGSWELLKRIWYFTWGKQTLNLANHTIYSALCDLFKLKLDIWEELVSHFKKEIKQYARCVSCYFKRFIHFSCARWFLKSDC